jgi:hypothetical protein
MLATQLLSSIGSMQFLLDFESVLKWFSTQVQDNLIYIFLLDPIITFCCWISGDDCVGLKTPMWETTCSLLSWDVSTKWIFEGSICTFFVDLGFVFLFFLNYPVEPSVGIATYAFKLAVGITCIRRYNNVRRDRIGQLSIRCYNFNLSL